MSDSATIIECQACHAPMERRGRSHKWCETCRPVQTAQRKREYHDRQAGTVTTPVGSTVECRRCHASMEYRGPNHKYCEACLPAQMKQHQQDYRDRQGPGAIAARRKAAYAAASPEQRRSWRWKATPEEIAAYQRAWAARKSAESRLWNRARAHRTTVAVLERMWDEQDGLCAICKGELGDDFHVDHDHATGKKRKLRALLCPLCNKGLGHFGDSAERLRQAADYLEHHSGLISPVNLVRRSRSVPCSSSRYGLLPGPWAGGQTTLPSSRKNSRRS